MMYVPLSPFCIYKAYDHIVSAFITAVAGNGLSTAEERI